MVNSSTSGDTSNFIQSGEWELVGFPVRRNLTTYSSGIPYPDVTFYVIMNRYLLHCRIGSLMISHLKQECIPVGCVPPAAVAIMGEGVGVCLSACWDTPPRCGPGDHSPRCGPGDPPWLWAWRPPWVWAWRPPRPDPLTSPWVWA